MSPIPSSQVQSVSELAVKVAQDPELQTKIRENPAEAIADMAAPLQTDKWIYRVVVGSLGLLTLITVIGAILLAWTANPLPEGVIALGSAAVGALAGLLAPSP